MAFTNVWRTVTCDNRPSIRPVTSSAASGQAAASGLEGAEAVVVLGAVQSEPEDRATSSSSGSGLDRVIVIARLLSLGCEGPTPISPRSLRISINGAAAMRITRRSSSSSVRPAANDSTNPASRRTSCTPGLSSMAWSSIRFRLQHARRIPRATRQVASALSCFAALRRREPPQRRVGKADDPLLHGRQAQPPRLQPLDRHKLEQVPGPIQGRPPTHRRRPVEQAERRVVADRPQVRHVTHPPAGHALIARAAQRLGDPLAQLVDRPESLVAILHDSIMAINVTVSRRHCHINPDRGKNALLAGFDLAAMLCHLHPTPFIRHACATCPLTYGES